MISWEDDFDAAFNTAPKPRLSESPLVLVWRTDEVFGRLYTTLVPLEEAILHKYERVRF